MSLQIMNSDKLSENLPFPKFSFDGSGEQMIIMKNNALLNWYNLKKRKISELNYTINSLIYSTNLNLINCLIS